MAAANNRGFTLKGTKAVFPREKPKKTPKVTSEIGPFTLVPEWVSESVSDGALRLYVTLGSFADRAGKCYPSRTLLAERMKCSVDTVDRRITELEEAKALKVIRRVGANGQRSNLYTLMQVRGRTRAAG